LQWDILGEERKRAEQKQGKQIEVQSEVESDHDPPS
jgi:hypothetical protein